MQALVVRDQSFQGSAGRSIDMFAAYPSKASWAVDQPEVRDGPWRLAVALIKRCSHGFLKRLPYSASACSVK